MLILSLAISSGWPFPHLDVNNVLCLITWAFERRSVYDTQPHEFEVVDKTLVCKLHKALYGLPHKHGF